MPIYDYANDSWEDDYGNPDDDLNAEWPDLRDELYSLISEDNASFNEDLSPNSNGEYSTGNIEVDLKAVIEALESGEYDPDTIETILNMANTAAERYLSEQDADYGTRMTRLYGDPRYKELWWYHRGY